MNASLQRAEANGRTSSVGAGYDGLNDCGEDQNTGKNLSAAKV
jgi:hypothetical protein